MRVNVTQILRKWYSSGIFDSFMLYDSALISWEYVQRRKMVKRSVKKVKFGVLGGENRYRKVHSRTGYCNFNCLWKDLWLDNADKKNWLELLRALAINSSSPSRAHRDSYHHAQWIRVTIGTPIPFRAAWCRRKRCSFFILGQWDMLLGTGGLTPSTPRQ